MGRHPWPDQDGFDVPTPLRREGVFEAALRRGLQAYADRELGRRGLTLLAQFGRSFAARGLAAEISSARCAED